MQWLRAWLNNKKTVSHDSLVCTDADDWVKLSGKVLVNGNLEEKKICETWLSIAKLSLLLARLWANQCGCPISQREQKSQENVNRLKVRVAQHTARVHFSSTKLAETIQHLSAPAPASPPMWSHLTVTDLTRKHYLAQHQVASNRIKSW